MTTAHVQVNGRPEHDYYRTPDWAAQKGLRRLQAIITPRLVLEPCAGDGALLPLIRATWPEATVEAYDIDPRGEPGVVVRRAMWFDDTPQRYDLVFTNPPYNQAEEFVRYGMSKLAPDGRLVLLLRLGFLASVERKALYRAHYPEYVFVLPERPSFRGSGTDFSDYAWFVWREGRRARHARLEHL